MSEASRPWAPFIHVHPEYIAVTATEVPTSDAARGLCAAIDDALARHRLRAVLFDSRDTQTPPKAASDVVWKWAGQGKRHTAVALVVKSELLKVSANMTALSQRVRLRSFGSIHDAESFLSRFTR